MAVLYATRSLIFFLTHFPHRLFSSFSHRYNYVIEQYVKSLQVKRDPMV